MDLNSAFKSACRIILGEEVGELKDFEEYLTRYREKLRTSKSASGRDVFYTAPYCKGSRLVPLDDVYSLQSSKPFDVNDIKDIDSLLRIVGERAYYATNKVIGKSSFVEESENIIDSSFVSRSSEVLRCEYVAYSSLIRDSKYMFGASCLGTSSFYMNMCESNYSQRGMESDIIFYSSDTYYSSNCRNCHDVMFCFDQYSKTNMIGNNILEKERYKELKGTLLKQMADELRRKKKLPSLIDFFTGGAK